MAKKLRFGILSTAGIGTRRVIPGMQLGEFTSVDAICSRDLARAQQVAKEFHIPRAYGSYEELLADSDIDAIYNPLPNHLHVPWTIKAAEAGKHVLCEKPISLTVEEARTLLDVRARTGVQIAEAFMVLTHPQWIRLRQLLDEGRIGELRSVAGFFSYYNVKPENIRNKVEWGGGGLMDIGCYLILAARYAFQRQPKRVVALIDRDPNWKTDRLTSALMDFGGEQAVFSCSTQQAPYQRLLFFGTKGRIEIEVPVNPEPNRPSRLIVDDATDLYGGGQTVETFPAVDQYTLQGDAFARAVFEGAPVPVSIESAIENMAVIEALFRSAESGHWETVEA